MPSVYDGILYNVAVVVAEELDPTTLLPFPDGIYHRLNCTQTVSITPQYSNGEETVVRQDMQILNTFRTPDLLYGYRIVLKNSYLNQEFMELVEGGEHIFNEYRMGRLEDGMVTKPFRLTLWVENYQGASVRNYVMLRYNYCYGKMDSVTLGQQFMMPTFTIEAREPTMLPDRPIRDVFYTDYLPDDPNAELPKRYGFRIDKNNPDPEGRIVYTHDAIGHVPARMDFTGGESKNLINSEWHRQSGTVTSNGVTYSIDASSQGSVVTFQGTLTATSSTCYFGNANLSSDTALLNWLKSTGKWRIGNSFTVGIDRDRSSLTINGSAVDLQTIDTTSTTSSNVLYGAIRLALNTTSTIIYTDSLYLSESNFNMIERFSVLVGFVNAAVGDVVSGTYYFQLEEGLYPYSIMGTRYNGFDSTNYAPNRVAALNSLGARGLGGTSYQSPNDKGRFLPASWETTFFIKNNKPVMLLDGEVDYELSKENQLYRHKKLDNFSLNLTGAENFEAGSWSGSTGNTSNSGNDSYARYVSPRDIPISPGATYMFTVNDDSNVLTANVNYYDSDLNYLSYNIAITEGYSYAQVVPINAAYFRIHCYSGSAAVALDRSNISINVTLVDDKQFSDVLNKQYQGDAMSEIPLCWLYQYEDENYEYCIVSNVQFDENYTAWAHQGTNGQINDKMYIGMYESSQALYTTSNTLKSLPFRTVRASIGYPAMRQYAARAGSVTGYDMLSNSKWNLLRMLTLLIGKSDNSQAIFGQGQPSGSQGFLKSGTLITNGQFNGTTYSASGIYKGVKLFYIENLWGNYYASMVGLRLNVGVYQKIQGNFIYDDLFDDIGQPNEYGVATHTFYSQTMMLDGARIPMNVSEGTATTYLCDTVVNQDATNSYPVVIVCNGNSSVIDRIGINSWYNHNGNTSSAISTYLIFDK